MARNNYEALNCQLLEELPRLTEKSIQFFKSCLATFVEARRVYLSELTGEIKLVIQVCLFPNFLLFKCLIYLSSSSL